LFNSTTVALTIQSPLEPPTLPMYTHSPEPLWMQSPKAALKE